MKNVTVHRFKVQGSKVVFTANPPSKVKYGGQAGTPCRQSTRLPKSYGEQVLNSIARKFGKRKVTLNL
jgi:hypothetical protein